MIGTATLKYSTYEITGCNKNLCNEPEYCLLRASYIFMENTCWHATVKVRLSPIGQFAKKGKKPWVALLGVVSL